MKSKFILIFHFIFFIILGSLTVNNLSAVETVPYVIFLVVYSLAILVGLILAFEYKKGVFLYLLSVLLFLGFPFKFSVHQILNSSYIEPVGYFSYSAAGYLEVLSVGTFGALGILIFECFLLFRCITKEYNNEKFIDVKNKFCLSGVIICTGIATLLGLLNLKYNIILFGMTPDVILPLKGNSIYFLVLTRFLPIAFFCYCGSQFQFKTLIFGTLLFILASIGVLSRMIVIIYFIVIGIRLLQVSTDLSFKKIAKNLVLYIVLLGLAGYATVSLSTRLRYVFNRDMSRKSTLLAASASKSSTLGQSTTELGITQKISEANKLGSFNSTLTAIKSLAIERWVGMEGLMAVVGYPNKGISLFKEALLEPSFKNDGKSFFNKIADQKLQEMMKEMKSHKNISTTVPGPIAFFYYTGNKIFVLLGMLSFCVVIYLLELVMWKLFSGFEYVRIYISVFMTFDFYQFGISPISFVKYWLFSFVCIYLWNLVLKNKIKLINLGWKENTAVPGTLGNQ